MYRYADITEAVAAAGPVRAAIGRAELRGASNRPEPAELRADAARDEPLPELPYRLFRTYVDDGDRGRFEGRYFERRRHLNSAAVVALLDGTPDDL